MYIYMRVGTGTTFSTEFSTVQNHADSFAFIIIKFTCKFR